MDIVVLAGGLSPERNVSFSSGAMVCEALAGLGHRVALVDAFLGLEDYQAPLAELFRQPPPLPEKGIKEEAPDLEAVKAARRYKGPGLFGEGVLAACQMADVVFMGLHGASGEDGRVQAALDLQGIPYTGSGYLGSAIAMDKHYTKQLARQIGVRTPDWRAITLTAQTVEDTAQHAALPCVVKVPNGGSSVGVYLCHTREELRHALTDSGRYSSRILLEQYIKGREFACGVLEEQSLPPIEIIPKEGFYDYRNKYQAGATLEVCPAHISGEAEALMRSAALRMHKHLGLAAYSRSDFILDEDDQVWFLEVNTLPGMTPLSLLPQEAAAVGIDYGTLCSKIIDASLEARHEGR
ncbi:MAG: D-alanine--D-alanine ligase [Oscillospiraceae bacterium]|nr:D-alanine--D-alanine ligase [Oscillospiraceae bacterium]